MTIEIKDINHYTINMNANEGRALQDINTLQDIMNLITDIARVLCVELQSVDINDNEYIQIEGEKK